MNFIINFLIMHAKNERIFFLLFSFWHHKRGQTCANRDKIADADQ